MRVVAGRIVQPPRSRRERNHSWGRGVARIDAGDELTFRNVDGHAHTVGGVAGTFGDARNEVPAG
jgi:plastocyanin